MLPALKNLEDYIAQNRNGLKFGFKVLIDALPYAARKSLMNDLPEQLKVKKSTLYRWLNTPDTSTSDIPATAFYTILNTLQTYYPNLTAEHILTPKNAQNESHTE